MKSKIHLNYLFFVTTSVTYWKYCDAGLRIIGSRNAKKGEFPFAVRLEEQYKSTINGKTETDYFQYCTGAAITPTWILTAAHCSGSDKDKQTFNQSTTIKAQRYARYNSYFPKEPGYLSPITGINNHPSYIDNNIMHYDIALYKTENVLVSHYGKISPVEYTSFVGHEAFVLGFGGTNATPTGKPLQVLKGIVIKCEIASESHYPGMFCVTPPCGLDATICGGDSGGPILHASGIIGVNSMSLGNCDEKSYDIIDGEAAAIIALVSPYIDWISNVIANIKL